MKKGLSLLMVFIIFVGVGSFSAHMSDIPYRVFANAVEVEKGGTISVPVSIENNGGMMGFAIVITYEADVFTPVSAAKGEAIPSGLFNDSIETAQAGSFKVIYTGNTNTTDNGVLFVLKFNLAEGATGRHSIGLSYIQADTFKEGWNDVVLNCENINVTITDSTTETETTPTETETETETTQPESSESETAEPQITDEPEKTLSETINTWFYGLSMPLRILLGAFILPISFIISLFE